MRPKRTSTGRKQQNATRFMLTRSSVKKLNLMAALEGVTPSELVERELWKVVEQTGTPQDRVIKANVFLWNIATTAAQAEGLTLDEYVVRLLVQDAKKHAEARP